MSDNNRYDRVESLINAVRGESINVDADTILPDGWTLEHREQISSSASTWVVSHPTVDADVTLVRQFTNERCDDAYVRTDDEQPNLSVVSRLVV
jgi:hypothetical protein